MDGNSKHTNSYKMWMQAKGLEVYCPQKTVLLKPYIPEPLGHWELKRSNMIWKIKRRIAIWNTILVSTLTLTLLAGGCVVVAIVSDRLNVPGWVPALGGYALSQFFIPMMDILGRWFPTEAWDVKFIHKRKRK